MVAFNFFNKKQEREKMDREVQKQGDAQKPQAVPAEAVSAVPAGSSKLARAVLERFHITEKTAHLADTGVYAFRVARTATRRAIRRAVEELYRVRVKRVNVVSMPSRAVHSRHAGTRPGFRKALVALEKGDKIEFI